MITRDTALRGVVPIAPTPFTPTGELDLEGQRRVLDCMVDQGVDGICILANYSEQFLLSDEEREDADAPLPRPRRRAACRSSSPPATSARRSQPSAPAGQRRRVPPWSC